MSPTPNSSDTPKRKHWPPHDPPMFWITVATFLVVACYTWLAHKQIQDTDKNYVAQNRPYVAFLNFQFRPYNKVMNGSLEGMRASSLMENFGNTPAVDVVTTDCDPLIRENDAPPAFNCHVSDAPVPGNDIGPKQTAGTNGDPISQSDLIDAENGTKFIYVFGSISYADAIGGPGNYLTRFCERLVFPSNPQSAFANTNPSISLVNSIAPVGGEECPDPRWTCVDSSCPNL